MRGDQVTEELGDNILSFLARHLGAVAGAVFVDDSGTYRRASTYGVPASVSIPEAFGLREGLLGQSAVEGRHLVIPDVPDGYLSFGSALGQHKPRHLIISPGAVDGTVNTVLELGFIREVEEDAVTLSATREGLLRH